MSTLPRQEYPRPQFKRDAYLNLNGLWQFEMDHGDSGRKRGLIEKELNQTILVPFCPESKLSTVEYKDFMDAVWYRRTFSLPEEAKNQRVLLHFGAVDYRCEVWINAQSAGIHEGGYSSFTFEITDLLKDGENTLVVCAQDHLRSGRQPFGKQSNRFESYGCSYTRTTGIWQTVWLEWVPKVYMESLRMIPDAQNGTLYADVKINGCAKDMTLKAEAFYEGKKEGETTVLTDGNNARFTLSVKNKYLWAPRDPHLYDLTLTLQKDEKTVDRAESYFGLRTVSFDGQKCLINGKPVFQRLILDQGFYPDGIYTAPTDEELKKDIERSMAMGFNGARLHQKVFEQRFLYWADKLGYICWGEMASWGIDPGKPHTMNIFLKEWLEVVNRDFNAPCIVGWCPYNEVWTQSNDGLREMTLEMTYRATKMADSTRPCIDTSGGWHTATDIYDVHDYEQSPEIYQKRYQKGAEPYETFEGKEKYTGGPYFVSEYGGIRWTKDQKGWGYGEAPKTEEEFISRYDGLTTALLKNPDHMGFCYTQLTDVEQEQNGLYTYDRQPKFPPEVIFKINTQKAAMEEE